jgi:nicotinate-nucleotide adenylyltransferase
MKKIKHLLIYGGSFDPPHLGHLNTAINVQNYFHFDRFIFLPCKRSVLKKSSHAPASARVEMLGILLKNHPQFSISTEEIDRATPSYMRETLTNFRNKLGPTVSITLLLGMDAYITLPQWFESEKIPTLCNLLIINRHGIKSVPNLRFNDTCSDPLDVIKSAHGKIVYFDAGEYSISSTKVRENIQNKVNAMDGLSKELYEYIMSHGLYTSL